MLTMDTHAHIDKPTESTIFVLFQFQIDALLKLHNCKMQHGIHSTQIQIKPIRKSNNNQFLITLLKSSSSYRFKWPFPFFLGKYAK